MITGFYLNCLESQAVGFIHDDGVYLIMAKAFASGQGPHLIHLVTQPVEVKYPFFYPWVLSFLWRLNPQFPQNLFGFQAFSVLCFLGALGFFWRFCRKIYQLPPWLCAVIMAFTAMNYYVLYFTTSVMSEALYMLLSFALLLVVSEDLQAQGLPAQDKAAAKKTIKLWLWVLLSVLMFHTRAVGITLIGAITLLLMLRREWRTALTYGTTVFVLTLLPWTLWKNHFTPVMTPLTRPILSAYCDYSMEFFYNLAHWDVLDQLARSTGVLSRSCAQMMFPIVTDFFVIFPKWYESFPSWAFWVFIAGYFTVVYGLLGYWVLSLIQACNRRLFGLAGLYAFIYLLLILVWNYQLQMTRFLLVVLPVLWLFFFLPIYHWVQTHWRVKNWVKPVSLTGLVVLIGVSLFTTSHSYEFLRHARHNHLLDVAETKMLWPDYQEAFQLIRQMTGKTDTIAAGWETVVYLNTERPMFYLYLPVLQKDKKTGLVTEQSYVDLYRCFQHYNVKYLLVEPELVQGIIMGPQSTPARGLIDRYPRAFKPLWVSSHHLLYLFKFTNSK